MPIYTYRLSDETDPCPYCPARQERVQAMSDAPLTECPDCERGLLRVVSLPMRPVVGQGKLTDARIGNSGMTKYANTGGGKYEKVAGPDEAPATIDRNAIDTP